MNWGARRPFNFNHLRSDMIKHKTTPRRSVIMDGKVYHANNDGIVMLPKVIRTKDCEPVESPKTPKKAAKKGDSSSDS